MSPTRIWRASLVIEMGSNLHSERLNSPTGPGWFDICFRGFKLQKSTYSDFDARNKVILPVGGARWIKMLIYDGKT